MGWRRTTSDTGRRGHMCAAFCRTKQGPLARSPLVSASLQDRRQSICSMRALDWPCPAAARLSTPCNLVMAASASPPIISSQFDWPWPTPRHHSLIDCPSDRDGSSLWACRRSLEGGKPLMRGSRVSLKSRDASGVERDASRWKENKRRSEPMRQAGSKVASG